MTALRPPSADDPLPLQSFQIAAGSIPMSSERKAFLVWWTALLLFIAIAAYIKHKKAHHEPEPKDNVTTVNPGAQNPSAN